jgi:hypothetical protein
MLPATHVSCSCSYICQKASASPVAASTHSGTACGVIWCISGASQAGFTHTIIDCGCIAQCCWGCLLTIKVCQFSLRVMSL